MIPFSFSWGSYVFVSVARCVCSWGGDVETPMTLADPQGAISVSGGLRFPSLSAGLHAAALVGQSRAWWVDQCVRMDWLCDAIS